MGTARPTDCVLDAESAGFPGGGVDEPAGTAGAIIDEDGACKRTVLAVKAIGLSFSDLAVGSNVKVEV